MTRPAAVKARKVAASRDNPEYLVESGKTGARAAHRTSELRKA
ncbi:HVA1 family protein [Brevundimonas sp. TWP2-3-2]